MNLILLSQEDFITSHRVRLTGRVLKHVQDVLKAQVGQVLQVGLLNGRMGTGTIVALTKRCIDLEVTLNQKSPAPSAIKLVLALPRPIVLKRLLPQITALGVKDMVLLQTKRVEKSYWSSPVLREENLREQMLLGLEQAKDTHVPTIQMRKRFKPFIEDEFQMFSKGTKIICAHPESQKSIPRRSKKSITLVIGPEGGFIPYEIDMLKSFGAGIYHMGERILKVETAVVGLLSLIQES